MRHPHVSFIIKDSDDWLQQMAQLTSIEVNETCNQAWAALGLKRRRQFRRDAWQGMVRYEGAYVGPLERAVKSMQELIDKSIMDMLKNDPALRAKLRSVT